MNRLSVDLDRLPARGPSPSDQIDSVEERFLGSVRPLVQVLTPSEREMVVEYVVRGRKLREIGGDRGVSESMVSRDWHGILDRLRERAAELGGYGSVAMALI